MKELPSNQEMSKEDRHSSITQKSKKKRNAMMAKNEKLIKLL